MASGSGEIRLAVSMAKWRYRGGISKWRRRLKISLAYENENIWRKAWRNGVA
jgi:hypothetical protein